MHAVASALLFLICSTATAAQIPTTFKSINPHRKTPLWVSAASALSPERRLRDDIVEPYERVIVENAVRRERERAGRNVSPLATSADPCDVRFGPPADDAPDMDATPTLDAVTTFARQHTIVKGTVTATDVGLYSGIPFTIVGVATSRQGTKYLLVPAGSLTIDGVRVCTSDPGLTAVPAVGDRIVAVVGAPIDANGAVYRLPAERLFVERGSRLLLPSALARDPAASAINDASQLELRLRGTGAKRSGND